MKNIILIGMSGVGKSNKGKYLAKKLGWKFIDTDEIIEDKYKMSIDNIFSKFGEDYFRTVESNIIKEISILDKTVISTGGGVVTRAINIEYLKQNGYIFLLLGKIQTLADNLNKSNVVRPLLKGSSDLNVKLEKLYKSREEQYLISSDVIIHIDEKSMEEVCKEILMEYDRISKLFSSCGK
jgi:shikimate kinase